MSRLKKMFSMSSEDNMRWPTLLQGLQRRTTTRTTTMTATLAYLTVLGQLGRLKAARELRQPDGQAVPLNIAVDVLVQVLDLLGGAPRGTSWHGRGFASNSRKIVRRNQNERS